MSVFGCNEQCNCDGNLQIWTFSLLGMDFVLGRMTTIDPVKIGDGHHCPKTLRITIIYRNLLGSHFCS